jgi:hypothetical protein
MSVIGVPIQEHALSLLRSILDPRLTFVLANGKPSKPVLFKGEDSLTGAIVEEHRQELKRDEK